MKLYLIGALACLSFFHTNAQDSTTWSMTSGEPIKNGSKSGYGRFATPFYNGLAMGTAQVSSKNDLFLQGTDAHGRGIYLYLFKKLSPAGIPIYDKPIKLVTPFPDKGRNKGVIMENDQKKIYSFWNIDGTLKMARFDRKTLKFGKLNSIKVEGIPGYFSDFGVKQLKNGKYLFLFSVGESGIFSNGAGFPHKITYTAEGFWPYDIQKFGVYGAITDQPNDSVVHAKALTKLDQSLYSMDGFAGYSKGEDEYIFSGSLLGNISAYKVNSNQLALSARTFVTNEQGIIIRNPNFVSSVAYFNESEDHQGLITVGEGGIYFSRNTHKTDTRGNMIFKNPEHLLQVSPPLYGGSLVVPNVVDWDGDGKLDIVSGNSMGFIFFFKNTGTNTKPVYQDPTYLEAGGQRIHVQPGYRDDIQGPLEARWGYTCPKVVDWNEDGLLDILTGDSRGKFMVYLNVGTKSRPKLAAEHPLYLDGMDMFGTWRVKPGVAKLGAKMAYIIMDKNDDFHLYWKLDAHNVEDNGKLTIGDSIPIHGNTRGGGTVGRSKFDLVDWDEDGVKDLLVGTYGKQSIPDTLRGLPLNITPKVGATVLFMKNTGTEEKPVFAFPKILKFKGKNLALGGHACAPSAVRLGPSDSLNLVVGIETGVFIYYDRKDLSW